MPECASPPRFDSVGNLVDLIRYHAASAGERPAIVDRDGVVSYTELAERIARYAGFLEQLGLRPKDQLALVLKDHADHFILILAAASLGAASLSVNWRSKIDEKRSIADAFAVDLLIHDPDVRAPEHARAVRFDHVFRSDAKAAAALEPNPQARSLPFRILLTSGSAGIPKGIELTHAGILGRCGTVRDALHLRAPQRHLSTSPLVFSGSLSFNMAQILLGNTVELLPAMFTPEEFVAAVRSRGITGSVIVPAVLRQLLALARDAAPLLPELQYLVSLGSPLSREERCAAAELITPGFYDCYGASGAGPMAILDPADNAARADSVGRAVPRLEVEIVDEQDRPLAAGQAGRLRCRGVGVADRFCNAAAVTADEIFRNGWYYPGEIGKMDEEGFISIIGRASDLILRSGHNVYPGEIEAVLMRHPNVRGAAVIGVPASNNDEEVVAFVCVSASTAETEILEVCRRNLIRYKVPSTVVIISEFPRTPAGKVFKPELLRMFQQRHSVWPA